MFMSLDTSAWMLNSAIIPFDTTILFDTTLFDTTLFDTILFDTTTLFDTTIRFDTLQKMMFHVMMTSICCLDDGTNWKDGQHSPPPTGDEEDCYH